VGSGLDGTVVPKYPTVPVRVQGTFKEIGWRCLLVGPRAV
jgi:hypothetical protein